MKWNRFSRAYQGNKKKDVSGCISGKRWTTQNKQMKITVVLSCVVTLLCYGKVNAQCTFTPTIPAAPILCPNETDTLWTQEYDGYQWYKDGVTISGATEQYLVVSEADILSYFKVAATDDGCTEMSDSVVVDAYTFLLPYIIHDGTFTTNPNDGSSLLCPGVDTMILTFSYPENVQWYDGGVAIPGATTPTLYVTEPGIYTAEGAPAVCPSYMAGSLDIVVNYITVDVSPDDLLLCPGETAILQATPADGTDYQWYKDNAPVPDATSPSLDVAQAEDAGSSFSISATIYGCAVQSDTILVDESVTVPISITASGGYDTGVDGAALLCKGDTLLLEVLEPYINNVQWYRNDTVIAGANGVVYMATADGYYMVEGHTNTCPDFPQNTADSPVVAVFTQPDPPVINLEEGQLVITPLAAAVYQWYLDDTLLPGATGTTYDPEGTPGDYSVEVTDEHGCSNRSAVFSYDPTGINQPSELVDAIKVYPNPATEIVQVISPVKVNISLWSIDGKLLFQQEGAPSLDIRHLEAGTYLLYITDKEQHFIKAEKLIKLK